ncbi:MAG TPA: hypothetical protein PK760_08785, partial [Flavobacteriales bacterium]|nr:hypothetical protein [Flavobacteriales bacterium]
MGEVFLSYRRTSDAHAEIVRTFGQQLRSRGVRVILDQFFLEENTGGPDNGWDKWSSDQALRADRVLIIGTPEWFQCFEQEQPPGSGLGAACEASDIRYRIYKASGVVKDIRVVLVDDAHTVLVPAKLDRYQRFHHERDLDAIVKWLNNGLKDRPVEGGPSLLSKAFAWLRNVKPEQKASFVMASNGDYSSAQDSRMHQLHVNLLSASGATDIQLVGCVPKPHRVQLRSSFASYQKLHELFLCGKLNELTGEQWLEIFNDTQGDKLPPPTQNPMVISPEYEDPVDVHSVVCHLEYISGLRDMYDKAVIAIGDKVTSSLAETRVYVNYGHDGTCYAQSNFIKQGCTHPTKMAMDRWVNLFTMLMNLTCTEWPNKEDMKQVEVDHVTRVHYYVDGELLSVPPALYCNAMNVHFVRR